MFLSVMSEKEVAGEVEAEDLTEKFAKLFESNDGWIVSSEEAGQQKVARIGNDSTIVDRSRVWVDVENKEEEGPTRDPFSNLNSCPQLFIADILRAEKKAKGFVFKNIQFRRAYISGTVISSYLHKERHTVVVDDGTSAITCFLGYTDYLSDYKTEAVTQKEDTRELLLENKDDLVFKAAYLVARNSLARINQMPMSYTEVDIGTKVCLFGNVKEYLESRYMFATKLIKFKDDSDEWLKHLKRLYYLYEHVYK